MRELRLKMFWRRLDKGETEASERANNLKDRSRFKLLASTELATRSR